jgi:signal transduction histidine kinase
MATQRLHSLLERQVRRARAADGAVDLPALLAMVSAAYDDHDRATRLADRAATIASEELTEYAASLQQERDANAEARIAAEAASAAKSAFLANMSHELRTPLNAIIGYSEMVREDLEDLNATGSIKDVDRVLIAAKHLLGLIEEVLDLSKVEAGRLELHPARCDVAALVSDCVDAVRPFATRNGNAMLVEIEALGGLAMVDAKRLRQCLFNLLSNAAKFCKGGTITVVLAPVANLAESQFRLSVADTGAGIPAAKVEGLFQPFMRAHTDVIEGTGLGLALTKRFCQLMGGDIGVVSTLGAGSCFTITLPLHFAKATQAA